MRQAAPPPEQEADPAAPAKPKLPQCFLHKKPNSACKNCQRCLAAKRRSWLHPQLHGQL